MKNPGTYGKVPIKYFNKKHIDICEESARNAAEIKLKDLYGDDIEFEERINAIKLNDGKTQYCYMITMFKKD